MCLSDSEITRQPIAKFVGIFSTILEDYKIVASECLWQGLVLSQL